MDTAFHVFKSAACGDTADVEVKLPVFPEMLFAHFFIHSSYTHYAFTILLPYTRYTVVMKLFYDMLTGKMCLPKGVCRIHSFY